MDKYIIEFLKKHDTVATYMTDEEMLEYYKRECPNDYNSLIKLYGE